MMALDLDKIMPHRPPMRLIDGILRNGADSLTAVVRIAENSFGLENNSVPVIFGIEYIAQSVAALAGLNFSKPGEKPAIGFLVGVRSYSSQLEQFDLGSELNVTVTCKFISEGAGVFDGQIHMNGELVATANITTYKPSDEQIEEMKRVEI
jgi:predicted hotdog family 3-hydroxylacyl-ACP dehydratase